MRCLFQEEVTTMRVIAKEEYLKNPCRAASVPYWKQQAFPVPDGMKILHQDDYKAGEYQQYGDEPYFRLIHHLQGLSAPVLPEGYSLCSAAPGDFAGHISSCYSDIGISEAELRDCTARKVYCADLWLAVRDDRTGKIAATGIAELDREIGEGVLEWIQVSEDHRGCGLGSYIVLELLWRMRDIARFVTVSGQCGNPADPEGLYRKCGFSGDDVWHILR